MSSPHSSRHPAGLSATRAFTSQPWATTCAMNASMSKTCVEKCVAAAAVKYPRSASLGALPLRRSTAVKKRRRDDSIDDPSLPGVRDAGHTRNPFSRDFVFPARELESVPRTRSRAFSSRDENDAPRTIASSANDSANRASRDAISRGVGTGSPRAHASTIFLARARLTASTRGHRTARTLQSTCAAVSARNTNHWDEGDSAVTRATKTPAAEPNTLVAVSCDASFAATSAALCARAKCLVSAARVAPAATPHTARARLPAHAVARNAPRP